MKELSNIKRFYFIGIGGIGMSALARYFFSKGYEVAGYDKTPSPLTDELLREGIQIHFEDWGKQLPTPYLDTATTVVVYTPAIPENMGELVFVKKAHQVYKRSEVLGLITQSSKGLGVAGTHGKTTTSSMLAFVLSQSHLKASAFLGGIASNFNSNVWIEPTSEYSVIEADEFDRSFLRLAPYASIITAMDPDHLDIYGTKEAFEEGFQMYADKHVGGGLIVYKCGLPLRNTGFNGLSYGIENQDADVIGTHLTSKDGFFQMDIQWSDKRWDSVKLGLPGIHNAENALAVAALCNELGLSETEIRNGLSQFKGVKRRFEYHVRSESMVYIDDYAHHPTEIAALVASVRLLYPHKKITGIFQPHLFSRTRDFMEGFVHELGKLDQVMLLPIYPARELPIPGITSDLIVAKIGEKAKLYSTDEIFNWAQSASDQVILTIGAGDIDRMVQRLAALFEGKKDE
jgi:UDP-N-acetylmuramate--alanine ligase